MRDGNESYDYRQGYAKGYNYGFWAGAVAAFLLSLALFYLIGISGLEVK